MQLDPSSERESPASGLAAERSGPSTDALDAVQLDIAAVNQEPRRGAGAPAAFSGQSAARYFRSNLKFATGLVGVVYVSGRANVTVLHEFRSARVVFQLYW